MCTDNMISVFGPLFAMLDTCATKWTASTGWDGCELSSANGQRRRRSAWPWAALAAPLSAA